MAAPIGSQVLGEVLPHLEIKKDNEAEEDIKIEVTVPDLTGKTINEAKKELKEIGLEINVQENTEINEKNKENEEEVILDQLPKAGIKIKQGNSIIVYK